MELFLGSNIYQLEGNNENVINHATHIYFQYFLADGTSDESVSFQTSICRDLLSLKENNTDIDYAMYSSASRDSELDRLITEDMPLVIAAFGIILIYLSLTLGKFNCVEGRVWLALSVLIVELFSLLMGFGLGSMIGTKFNTVCALIPFILFGVGVDDMIIIVDTFDRVILKSNINIHDNTNNDTMKELMGVSLSESGLSITLTSLSSTIAFAIGSMSTIPGISAFCTFSAFCFFADYLLQLFLFVPFLAYDQRRIINYGNVCICCISHNPTPSNNEIVTVQNSNGYTKTPATEIDEEFNQDEDDTNGEMKIMTENTMSIELSPANYERKYNPTIEMQNDTDFDDNEFSVDLEHESTHQSLKKRSVVKGMSVISVISLNRVISMEITYDETQDEFHAIGCFGKIFLNTMLAVLTKNFIRIIIIIVTFLVCAASICGLLNVEADINLNTLFPDDSFLLDYFNVLDTMFPSKFVSQTYFMIKDIDLYDDAERNELYDYIDNLDNMTDIAITNVDHWLDEYDLWLMQTINETIDDFDMKQTFYDYLIQFTDDGAHRKWKSEIVYKYNEQQDIDHISSMRISRFTFALLPFDRYYPYIDQYHEISRKSNLESYYIWDIFLILSETTHDLMRYVLENVVFAIIGVLGTLLFFVDILTLFIVGITIIIINIDLFGWIYIMGIVIDPIIYTTFVMSVGLTVDYVIHVTHALLQLDKERNNNKSNKEWFNKRLKIAFIEMGLSVIKGAFTTFIGCCALAFSESRAFRDFFIVICGIILISMIHGLFFVPSIVGTCFVPCIRHSK